MRIAVDNDSRLFYSTPDDLRKIADALEKAGDGEVEIAMFDSVVDSSWRKASVTLLKPEEWEDEEEDDELDDYEDVDL